MPDQHFNVRWFTICKNNRPYNRVLEIAYLATINSFNNNSKFVNRKYQIVSSILNRFSNFRKQFIKRIYARFFCCYRIPQSHKRITDESSSVYCSIVKVKKYLYSNIEWPLNIYLITKSSLLTCIARHHCFLIIWRYRPSKNPKRELCKNYALMSYVWPQMIKRYI